MVKASDPTDVVVTSAGSLPGDLLKLWRSRESLSYQVEYGYSVMGYEIAGGIGAKLADPSREVFVMSGDASFLMMNSELATAVQEGIKITLVLIDNHGYSSVGNVSEQVGCEGFGCHYRFRGTDGKYSGDLQHHDLGKICEGLGARVLKVSALDDFEKALFDARGSAETHRASSSRPTGTSAFRATPPAGGIWRLPRSRRCRLCRPPRQEYVRNKGQQRWLSTLGTDPADASR